LVSNDPYHCTGIGRRPRSGSGSRFRVSGFGIRDSDHGVSVYGDLKGPDLGPGRRRVGKVVIYCGAKA
jgi:hypothetical protein